jgi:hypothetical protein
VGRLVLICRLAARDLRRRPGEASLLLVAIVATTATLTLGLLLRGVTSELITERAQRRRVPMSSAMRRRCRADGARTRRPFAR